MSRVWLIYLSGIRKEFLKKPVPYWTDNEEDAKRCCQLHNRLMEPHLRKKGYRWKIYHEGKTLEVC